MLNFEHDGTFKHDPNPLVESNLAELKDAVSDKQADIGVCFDGDADRLIVVDENAHTVSCDLLTVLLAQYFLEKNPGAAVVYDLRSSRVVCEEIRRYRGEPQRSRVGHTYMKKVLKEIDGVFGGELSGHFYYRDNFYADSGMITLVHLINVLSATDKTMSELVAPLLRYSNSGELNFEVDDKEGMMQKLEKKYSDACIDHLDGVTVEYPEWWFNCRPSNTESLLRLNLEAQDLDLLKAKLENLKSLLGEPIDY